MDHLIFYERLDCFSIEYPSSFGFFLYGVIFFPFVQNTFLKSFSFCKTNFFFLITYWIHFFTVSSSHFGLLLVDCKTLVKLELPFGYVKCTSAQTSLVRMGTLKCLDIFTLRTFATTVWELRMCPIAWQNCFWDDYILLFIFYSW